MEVEATTLPQVRECCVSPDVAMVTQSAVCTLDDLHGRRAHLVQPGSGEQDVTPHDCFVAGCVSAAAVSKHEHRVPQKLHKALRVQREVHVLLAQHQWHGKAPVSGGRGPPWVFVLPITLPTTATAATATAAGTARELRQVKLEEAVAGEDRSVGLQPARPGRVVDMRGHEPPDGLRQARHRLGAHG